VNVLFDLDGTLTDPREGIVACMRHALRSLGRTIPPDSVLETFIGPPLKSVFQDLLGSQSEAHEVESAMRILEHFGLVRYFDAVYGSELDGRFAEKVDLIGHILATSGLSASDTLMVGDRRHDVIGAVRNNVIPVGVLWGYGSEEELTAAGAERLLVLPREAADLVV
jgi:phosphoglycolate phosphatase